jgi:hypothetical protein
MKVLPIGLKASTRSVGSILARRFNAGIATTTILRRVATTDFQQFARR